jgi:hypothetical protein
VQEHNGKLELRKSNLGGLAVDVELAKWFFSLGCYQ